MSDLTYEVTTGDLLKETEAEAWVNPWNRNFVPRHLLIPHGVSGAIKKLTGPEPWKELAKRGLLAEGEAVMTSGGRIPQKLIHVAGLTWYWKAKEEISAKAVRSALQLALEERVGSLAIPLIGAGVGGLEPSRVEALTVKQLEGVRQTARFEVPLHVKVIRWEQERR